MVAGKCSNPLIQKAFDYSLARLSAITGSLAGGRGGGRLEFVSPSRARSAEYSSGVGVIFLCTKIINRASGKLKVNAPKQLRRLKLGHISVYHLAQQ